MGEKDYLVTDDVVETLTNRYGFDLSYQQRDEIQEATEFALEEGMPEVIPDNMDLTVLDAEELIQWAESELEDKYLLISIDGTYYPGGNYEGLEVVELGLTRETEPDTGEYWVRSRDPTTSFKDAVESIATDYEFVQVFDGGAFTGGTINRVTGELKNSGVEIEKAVVPVANTDADIETDRVSIYRRFDFGDWLEARDIAAIDGRKVPRQDRKDQPRTFIPYWEDPQEMASIGEKDPSKAEDFEELSRSLNSEIQEIIGEEVGNRVEAEWD
ncbi:MAG: hypothetical protein ABEJ56_02265 [Candidatus Nanohaloarchaea archaeon]